MPLPPGPRPPATTPILAASIDAFAPGCRGAWDRRGAILEAAVSNVSI